MTKEALPATYSHVVAPAVVFGSRAALAYEAVQYAEDDMLAVAAGLLVLVWALDAVDGRLLKQIGTPQKVIHWGDMLTDIGSLYLTIDTFEAMLDVQQSDKVPEQIIGGVIQFAASTMAVLIKQEKL